MAIRLKLSWPTQKAFRYLEKGLAVAYVFIIVYGMFAFQDL